MCNKCKRLLELYAETQLECLKRNKEITATIKTKCEECGQDIFIAVKISDKMYYAKIKE